LGIKHDSTYPLSCVSRFVVQDPPFIEKIFCLALIMGESCDSGQDPGFDEKGKITGNLGRFPNDSRARCGACPRLRIRADYRRVPTASICSYALSRWEEESLYLDIGYPISEKRYRMFRGFGMFRKRGLR